MHFILLVSFSALRFSQLTSSYASPIPQSQPVGNLTDVITTLDPAVDSTNLKTAFLNNGSTTLQSSNPIIDQVDIATSGTASDPVASELASAIHIPSSGGLFNKFDVHSSNVGSTTISDERSKRNFQPFPFQNGPNHGDFNSPPFPGFKKFAVDKQGGQGSQQGSESSQEHPVQSDASESGAKGTGTTVPFHSKRGKGHRSLNRGVATHKLFDEYKF